MIEKYNPHSLQKQARKWPVFLSDASLPQPKTLNEDMQDRLSEAWTGILKSPYPICSTSKIPEDFMEEFGIDACRVAAISPGNNREIEHALELAFKWVGSVFSSFTNIAAAKTSFNSCIWVEAVFASRDLLNKNKAYQALARLKKAQKLSPINTGLSKPDQAIILAGLFPFIPITVGSLAFRNEICLSEGIEALIASMADIVVIKYSIGSSGWNWGAFNKDAFENSKKNCFNSLPIVKKSFGNKEYQIKQVKNGFKLCLPT